jgi:hypothetical protein
MAEEPIVKALALLRAAVNAYEANDADEAQKLWAECKDILNAEGMPAMVKAQFAHMRSDAYERYEERNPTGQSLEMA